MAHATQPFAHVQMRHHVDMIWNGGTTTTTTSIYIKVATTRFFIGWFFIAYLKKNPVIQSPVKSSFIRFYYI